MFDVGRSFLILFPLTPPDNYDHFFNKNTSIQYGARNMRTGMKRIYECLLMLLISGSIALIYNALSPNGIALVGQWDTEQGVISAVARNNPVVHDIEIDSVQMAKEIFDTGQSVFVDARPLDNFNEGHIQGAYPLPIGSFEDGIEQFYETYPFSTHIVTYCTGRECLDSHELAQFLMDIGYNDVRVFIDGYPAWEENGLPIEKESGEGEDT
jgi:rhodanese-related sulfurtransferase